ncbi:hypothetical protein P43SY_004033 [Pythium insidiosum]|uniref:Apple domain-containing protein n=1 Tax=Pythium insidiosum TaxID=114742 RepID=A0AAD5Q514_PYTIN|nr:hypothetical protein P43SY_004033 [Pythium insidiosum]
MPFNLATIATVAAASLCVAVSAAPLPRQCLPYESYVDYPGNDIDRTNVKDVGECCQRCLDHPQCEAYTWNNWDNICYMKSKKADKPFQGTPDPDSPYKYASGVVYKCKPLQFNLDYPGNDITSVRTDKLGECCTHCRTTEGCVGWAWSKNNGGFCWLKSKFEGEPVFFEGAVSAAAF